MDQKTLLWILVIVVLLVFVIYFIYRQAKKKGLVAEKENESGGRQSVAKKLRKIGRRRGWKVLEEVSLPSKKGRITVSQVVVGPFGVIAVESRGYTGAVYANETDEQWVHTNGDKREKFENLLLLGDTAMESIRRVFAKADVYRVDLFKLAVFDGRKLEVYAPKSLPVYSKKQLRKVLKQPQFRSDNGVNVARVCEVLQNPPQL